MKSEIAEKHLDLSDERNVKRFIREVVEARDNGYELCCVFCGTGVLDGLEVHAPYCPCHEPAAA